MISKFSLKPIFNYLEKKLSGKIYFYEDKIDEKAIKASKKLKPGEILLLENIRFFQEEESDDEDEFENTNIDKFVYLDKILEIPIVFTDRTVGESKMNRAIVIEAILMVPKLFIKKIFKLFWNYQ